MKDDIECLTSNNDLVVKLIQRIDAIISFHDVINF